MFVHQRVVLHIKSDTLRWKQPHIVGFSRMFMFFCDWGILDFVRDREDLWTPIHDIMNRSTFLFAVWQTCFGHSYPFLDMTVIQWSTIWCLFLCVRCFYWRVNVLPCFAQLFLVDRALRLLTLPWLFQLREYPVQQVTGSKNCFETFSYSRRFSQLLLVETNG